MAVESPKRVVEEITVPGMIVAGTGMAKEEDIKVRFKLFTVGPAAADDGTDGDESLHLEALLNRDDVIILDYHKYTFQHTFHVAVTYSEPVGKKSDKDLKDKRAAEIEKDMTQAV